MKKGILWAALVLVLLGATGLVIWLAGSGPKVTPPLLVIESVIPQTPTTGMQVKKVAGRTALLMITNTSSEPIVFVFYETEVLTNGNWLGLPQPPGRPGRKLEGHEAITIPVPVPGGLAVWRLVGGWRRAPSIVGDLSEQLRQVAYAIRERDAGLIGFRRPDFGSLQGWVRSDLWGTNAASRHGP